jgi:hypothetical protein
MNYYTYSPYWPTIYGYQIPQYDYRNYYPILDYPSYYNNHFYSVPDYESDRLSGNFTFQNLGATQWFQGGYLDINPSDGSATLTKSPTASGIKWRITDLGGNLISLQNMGGSGYQNYYLDIDPRDGRAVLTQSGDFSGTKWRFYTQSPGVIKLQNMGNSPYKYHYLDIDPNDGKVVVTKNPMASGTNWRINRVRSR